MNIMCREKNESTQNTSPKPESAFRGSPWTCLWAVRVPSAPHARQRLLWSVRWRCGAHSIVDVSDRWELTQPEGQPTTSDLDVMELELRVSLIRSPNMHPCTWFENDRCSLLTTARISCTIGFTNTAQWWWHTRNSGANMIGIVLYRHGPTVSFRWCIVYWLLTSTVQIIKTKCIWTTL